MADAPRDNNNVPTMLGTSATDGSTPVPVKADPTTHAIWVDDAATGSDLSGDVAARDANGVTVLMGVSSADGVTPTPIYVRASDGYLLVDSS